MKFFLLFSISILFGLTLQAQTITKLNGSTVIINVPPGEEMEVDTEILFLRDDLSVAASGKVTQISAEGRKALVKVSAGKVTLGMPFEKRAPVRKSKAETKSSASKKANYENLSERERSILQQGPISRTRYIVGGVLGTYPLGLGIGHAIQGRYAEKGWIFTVGELGSIAVAAAGIGDCFSSNYSRSSCNGGLVIAGLVGYVGFRIWEIVDVWAAPPEHNRRYEEIKSRLGESEISFRPAILPLADGGMLGLQIRF